MLRVEGLGKRYGHDWVFRNVSFTVGRGELVAVLGESGVGKSTLLNGLAGLDAVQEGRVELNGTSILQLQEAALAHWRRRDVGFVFQAFHVLPHLSVAQNVALPLLLLQGPRAEREARVRDMLHAVGLQGFEAREPRTLSGGQLQRVAIARALAHRPTLVLADEPTGNLDPETAERVMALLSQQVREMQAGCVLVTHSQAAA
ncbi:MAG: ABC transporter ATP-binding protein, partial [Betaproteobacteria bacterium]